MLIWLAIVGGVLLAATFVFADGPLDNNPTEVRRIPKLGIELSADDRKALDAALAEYDTAVKPLVKSKDAKVQDLLPDVLIYGEAVRTAVEHQEFFDAKEVTVEQFQRFLRANPRFGVASLTPHRYSPDPDGPWNRPDWYTAAAYCNWLSAQEGLPKDQWCYLPTESGDYAAGMTIPADALQRTGYRLPTGAEWEYACRSGTITSRYFGLSTDLLGKHAWYQANSREHAWSGASLLPNDLGLFDMLGNVYEWCQEPHEIYQPTMVEAVIDDINIRAPIGIDNPRLLRGGAFTNRPALARAADRNWIALSIRNFDLGFRLARTYN